MSYSRKSLAQSVSKNRAESYLIIRVAAKLFALPYSILKDYGIKQNKVSSMVGSQRLFPNKEQPLVNWISDLIFAKNTPSHLRVW